MASQILCSVKLIWLNSVVDTMQLAVIDPLPIFLAVFRLKYKFALSMYKIHGED